MFVNSFSLEVELTELSYINISYSSNESNISEDPLFCDVGNSDFSIASNSPAILGLIEFMGSYGIGCDAIDCNGVVGGSSYIDDCGDCVGGDTGLEECVLSVGNYFPEDFNIISVYPNPFNPVASMRYSIPRLSMVTAHIYDLSGKLIETLIDSKSHPAGIYDLMIHTDNMASGVYFIHLDTVDEHLSHKITVIK